jgi:hypothetical protein
LVIEISPTEEEKILSLEEGHFADFKGIAISPAKLTKTIAAFSNAEGGEAYVGISQSSARTNFWAGFQNIEAANGHIQAFERPSVPSNVTLSPIPRRCPWNTPSFALNSTQPMYPLCSSVSLTLRDSSHRTLNRYKQPFTVLKLDKLNASSCDGSHSIPHRFRDGDSALRIHSGCRHKHSTLYAIYRRKPRQTLRRHRCTEELTPPCYACPHH